MSRDENENRRELLLRASQSWQLEWNLEPLLAAVVSKAVELTGAEQGIVFLQDTAGLSSRAVWPALSSDECAALVQRTQASASEALGCARLVIQSSAPGEQRTLCLPLGADTGAFGALCLLGGGSAEPDHALLGSLSTHAAFALQQAILYQSAITDALTGLANRIHFLQQLQAAVRSALRLQHPLALVVLDLDNFSELNERGGREAGDEALVKVAGLLRQALRETDLVARFGSDEFALLLPATSHSGALEVARKMRADIAGLVCLGTPKLVVSAGLALYPDNASNDTELLLRADEALHQGKAAGGDCLRSSQHKTALIRPASGRGSRSQLSVERHSPRVLVPDLAALETPQPQAPPSEARPDTHSDVTGVRSLAQIFEARRNGDLSVLRTFTPKRLLEVVQRAGEVLTAAHRRQNTHLGLSPAQVLISECGAVTIVGWGDQRHSDSAALLDGSGCLAPEQLAGSDQLSGPASDVHALGAMLYTVLTEQPPYQRDSAEETLAALRQGEIVGPRSLMQDLALDPALAELATQALSLDPGQRPSAAAFSEQLGRYVRGEQVWVTQKFGSDLPLVFQEWSQATRRRVIPATRDWVLQDGEWVSQLPVENILIWNVPVAGQFRFVAEGWIEESGELTLIGLLPAPGTPDFSAYGGYYLAYGADYGTCAKLTREGTDVMAFGCPPLEPRRRYRLELEYQPGWVFGYVDGKRIFSYRELFPFAGSRLGFYAYGKGTHFKPLELQQPAWNAQAAPNSLADTYYAQGAFATALARYQEVAERSPQRMEGHEARLKMGMCQARTHSPQSARETFQQLGGSPLEPFALAEEANLEFALTKPEHRRRGLELCRQLFTRFPNSQARIRVLQSWRHRPVHMNPEYLEVDAEWLKLARTTSQPPVQSQIFCQRYRTVRLARLGRWQEALADLLEFQQTVLPEQQLIYTGAATFLMAALANNRDELIPDGEWLVDEPSGFAPLLPAVVRRSDPPRWLERLLELPPDQPRLEWYLIVQLFLLLGRQNECNAWLQRCVAARCERDVGLFSTLARTLVDCRAEALFAEYMACAQKQVQQNPESLWASYFHFYQARWALEGGALERAARALQRVPQFIDTFPSDNLVLRALLYSLNLIRAADGQLEALFEQNLAGTELDLVCMFLGKKAPRPGALWPHPGWRPEWRLWLALWLEAKGQLAAAREVAQPAIDPRFGSIYLQQPLNALLRRVSAERPAER